MTPNDLMNYMPNAFRTKQERVYISGPITGVNNFEDSFIQAENKLLNRGYTTVSHCSLNNDHGKTWEEHRKLDIAALINCDTIFLLKGWETSRVATLEKLIAVSCGLRVKYE